LIDYIGSSYGDVKVERNFWLYVICLPPLYQGTRSALSELSGYLVLNLISFCFWQNYNNPASIDSLTGEAMKAKKRERYRIRIKKVEADLLEFGISAGSVRKLIYRYPVGVLERLIEATKKRQPDDPASYFLNGLKKSRMKHSVQRNLTDDEEV